MGRSAERAVAGLCVVITGATGGIGRELARELSRRGAAVTILARDRDRGEAVARSLPIAPGDSPAPEVVVADLGDLGSVRRAADELNRRYGRIDVLVNNAGVAGAASALSPDGFDLMMATNHLGPFLLTNLLLARLAGAGSARIVNTASEAHRYGGRPEPASLGVPAPYGMIGAQRAYACSKLMNVLFTAELARRLDGTDITANCFCPGLVATGLAREAPAVGRALGRLAGTPLVRRPDQGARMGLRLVLDPELDGVSGKFFTSTPGARLLPSVAAAGDAAYQRQVWERSAALVGLPT